MPELHDVATPRTLRITLRERTADLHHRLDHLPDQRALMAPGLELARYAAILAGHEAAHARCETRLARLAAGRPDGLRPYASRLPALRADLGALGRPCDGEPERAGDGPVSEDAPDDREGAYLGFRYVLEGATQGARFIAARLARSLPELVEDRFAFWRVQVAEAGSWAALVRTLEARPADGRLADAAVAGAAEAFGTFLAAFDDASPRGSAHQGAPA